MTVHSVFDPLAGDPGTVTRFDDGIPSIVVSNAFYTFSSAAEWYCVGGKVYVADNTGIDQIQVSAWQAEPPVTTPDLTGVPLRTATIVNPVVGWNQATWEALLMERVTVAGQATFISYQCSLPATYFAETLAEIDAVLSYDGSDLALAEQPFRRGYFKLGADPVVGANTYYATDILVDDQPPTPPVSSDLARKVALRSGVASRFPFYRRS